MPTKDPEPKVPPRHDLRIQATPEEVADAVLKGGAPRKPKG